MTSDLAPKGPLRLVIFDCDGVLVDSETPSNRVVAEELTLLGWPTTTEESLTRFTGSSLPTIAAAFELTVGRAPPPGWVGHVTARLVDVLGREVEPMPGAADLLRAVTALGLPYRVASNSSHPEMRAKFARTGLAELVEGRVHSAFDVALPKPAPYLFLAAAAAAEVPPGECVVVEDSLPGVHAAVAAGMACIGLDPAGDGARLCVAGAHPVRALADIPALLRAALRQAA